MSCDDSGLSEKIEEGQFELSELSEHNTLERTHCTQDEWYSTWTTLHSVTSAAPYSDNDFDTITSSEQSKWNRVRSWFDDSGSCERAYCGVPNPFIHEHREGYRFCNEHYPEGARPLGWEVEVGHAGSSTENDFIIREPRPADGGGNDSDVVDMFAPLVAGLSSHPAAAAVSIALNWIGNAWGVDPVEVTEIDRGSQRTYHWDIILDGMNMEDFPGKCNNANVRYNVDPVRRGITAELKTRSRFEMEIAEYGPTGCPCQGPSEWYYMIHTTDWNESTYELDVE